MISLHSFKEQLRRLIDIQAVDREIYALKASLRERPEELECLKQEFESKKISLKQVEGHLKTIQVSQKELDSELKAKEAEITKAEASMLLLKTNKEYQARLLEIEGYKADKSVIEEKLLLGYDTVDAAHKSVENERAIAAEYEKEYLAKKKEVEDAVRVMTDQSKVKESQRERITPDVRPDLLSRYDRIVKNKEGLAIVEVKDHVCMGCYMHVTDQVMNQIRMHDQLICCDVCARILYLAEEI